MKGEVSLARVESVRADNYHEVLAPVREAISFTETYEEYCAALQPFTRNQRLMMALSAYTEELDGGHVMFFGSPMGVMWQDVQEALRLIGDERFIKIYDQALALFGGAPSFDDDERYGQLESHEDGFGEVEALNELDEAYYEIDAQLHEQIARFIREHAPDFVCAKG
ncbi:MAG: DUF4375 domain-containing protein [Neisseria sp.]|nr:DUF4375 domain-containing protein [Neisseria sp.]